jgi:hypothetical protein
MIGVICKPNQAAVVKEFFQLFKTPWEFFVKGRHYDVVIATAENIEDVNTKLLLLYGAASSKHKATGKIKVSSKLFNIRMSFKREEVPIYKETLIFEEYADSEPFVMSNSGVVGLKVVFRDMIIMRLGYDLFNEIEYLLAVGQPVYNSLIPTLDIHIQMLKEWIVESGIGLLEIPPIPGGSAFAVCLTHDIDFIGIRRHRFDHTMWGFLLRSTVGAIRNFINGRVSFTRLLKSWLAALSLPLVYMGWREDYWEPFDRYLQLEKGLPTTYFLIPYKNRIGAMVSSAYPNRRACIYDISEIPEWTSVLIREGCEIGVHGIDSWHDMKMGQQELARIAEVSGKSLIGIRMHWLLKNENTTHLLDEAGFIYDSSYGYNESIGFLCGTTQMFRPINAHRLLELPINIQDGALFFEKRLGLSESAASILCSRVIRRFKEFGGVLTIIWHDRSLGPERFWGDFYKKLLADLKSQDVWFGTASQLLDWYEKRREVVFEPLFFDGKLRIKVRSSTEDIQPPLVIRIHSPKPFIENRQLSEVDKDKVLSRSWSGEEDIIFDPL